VVGPDGGALGFRGTAVIAPAAPEWIERRHARLAMLVHLARLDRHLRHLNNTHTHIVFRKTKLGCRKQLGAR